VLSGASSPHAALLIDFDNVTMGMRSDLSKELKTLLDSDVIKGKVSVQRAYADWRRYPQYIVPLSEASVDLIFAPAYGSNKKNATDIRMAIDAVELVFIRPEIGTYILLTGDSDFSSLVLKLKEYGKYVIGVGIQESSSDILVQNCDEYYSYTSLTGLTKTTDLNRGASDPWVLVRDAVSKMVSRDDVMRSDRLKQVMQEIDPSFDESALGFSKFSKFLSEASSRGLVKLRKLENGQYEIEPAKGGSGRSSRGGDEDSGRGRRDRKPRGRGGRGRDRDDDKGRSDAPSEVVARQEEPAGETPAARAPEARSEQPAPTGASGPAVDEAYAILKATLERLLAAGRSSVRDSDVKRKILEKNPDFDEAELGFPKFSKFLSEGVDRGVIVMTRSENGASEVSLPEAGEARDAGEAGREEQEPRRESRGRGRERPQATEELAERPTAIAEAPQEQATEGPTVIEVTPPTQDGGRKLGPRRGSTRRRSASEDETIPLFEGQAVPAPSAGGSAGRTGERTGGADRVSAVQTEAIERSARTETADRSSAVQERPAQDRGAQERGKQEQASQERATAERSAPAREAVSSGAGGATAVDLKGLGLPSDPDAIVRYMTHRYKGVGQKTAETIVDRFGADVFTVLRDDPDRLGDVVPAKRAEQLVEAWAADYERRTARRAPEAGATGNDRGD